MQRALRALPLAGVVAAAGLQAAYGQDEGVRDNAPERCVSVTRVDKTEVMDDRTIVFHMRGGRMYLNHLSRECPGLEREERFMYSPTSNRLCDIDTVTVLENRGFGLTRGFTCSLGMFHPITTAELEDLRRLKKEGGRVEEGDFEGQGDFEVVPVDPDDTDTPADAGDNAEAESTDRTTESDSR